MTRTADRVLWPSLWLTTLLFLGWGLVPRAALFTSVLSPVRLVGLAALAKLALLLLGTAWSWRSRAALEAGNPVRPAWTLLAGGLLATFLGQALLARYQLAGEPTRSRPRPTSSTCSRIRCWAARSCSSCAPTTRWGCPSARVPSGR